MKFTLHHSNKSGKKYAAVFTDGSYKKTIHFGATGYQDYTQHKDPQRRSNYLSRHRKNESWSNPQTAGALSRWILWGPSTSLQANVTNFKRKFHLT